MSRSKARPARGASQKPATVPVTSAAAPGSSRPSLEMFLGLVLVGVAAFGATFAVVRWYGQARPPLPNSPPPSQEAPPGMVWVPGGEFSMGTDSDLGWPDEKPAHRVKVDG